MIKGIKSQDAGDLSWRPNFRDFDSLPDIKAVRTNFFVSAVALTLAVMALMFVGFREYKILVLQNSVSDLKVEIDAKNGDRSMAVGQNNKFTDKFRKIEEVENFLDGQLKGSDLLIRLNEALLDGMSLKTVQYTEEVAIIEGYLVEGSSPDSMINEYVSRLKENAAFQAKFEQYNQLSVELDSKTGNLVFQLEIKNPEGDSEKKAN